MDMGLMGDTPPYIALYWRYHHNSQALILHLHNSKKIIERLVDT